jgi:hypothetical protein
VSDHCVGHDVGPHGLPDDHSQAEDDASSRSAARLLQPRRSYGLPLIVFGVVALLIAIGISRLGPVDQLNEAPVPPKRPDRFLPEQPVEPTEPFKSLVLDAAQSFMAAGRLPVATTAGPSTKPSPTTR